MINSHLIYDKANQLVKKTSTRNPILIAKELRIEIYRNNDFERLLGMYTYLQKKRAIVINNRLDPSIEKIVLAHEIGHDLFHRHLAKDTILQEFQLFNMKNTTEYEANAFAAHLLLDTTTFINDAHEGMDIATIASKSDMNINLALIKVHELIKLGYDLRLPMEARTDFMKDLTV